MKAKVKKDVTYGPAGIFKSGAIVNVTVAELEAFSDKLTLIVEDAMPPMTAYESPAPTPAAIELAGLAGIDIGIVEGTGKHGRVTVHDVQAIVTAQE